MLLYSHIITPRLQYITGFIGNEITGKPFELTTDKEIFRQYSFAKVNYSSEPVAGEELQIIPVSLLFGKNIQPQNIQCFNANGYKAFFKTSESGFPFDIFAASFYLLARYEEYLPHANDMYGRYAHENALAFKENFLHLPLVNIWIEDFKKVLQSIFPSFTIHHSPFTFLPTYDIDIAYSYKHKGWLRNLSGVIKSFFQGEWSMIKERLHVLNEKQDDPYDSYAWLDALHKKHKLNPCYFFHVAANTGRYDKNISPENMQMQQLIRQHAAKYKTGIHPSWQSGDDSSLIKKEKNTLEEITGRIINMSRQHYIRFTLPQTFRQLMAGGINEDYSMGYGSINGFRASVASSFYWYDLEKEEQTALLLHPFCYMDANSFYEQKFSAHQALDEMRRYHAAVKAVNGIMITIWHNTFAGTAKMFAGWRQTYETFISEVTSASSSAGSEEIL